MGGPKRPCLFCRGTLKQQSIVYSFEFDCLLDASDHIAALGWPADDENLWTLSKANRKSMTGDGMSAPCIASCVYAYWLNPFAPWWQEKAEEHKHRMPS